MKREEILPMLGEVIQGLGYFMSNEGRASHTAIDIAVAQTVVEHALSDVSPAHLREVLIKRGKKGDTE